MDRLIRIANYILIRSCCIYTPGLYHGKTGIVLALGLFAKKHNNNILMNFVLELFEELYGMIPSGINIGMESGLCGIGYGITLMKKSEIIDCDLNDVLFDIDKRIMDYDPRRISDFSYRKGVAGIIRYIQCRQSCPEMLKSIDSMYLRELEGSYKSVEKDELCTVRSLMTDIGVPQWDEDEFVGKNIGIDNGISYFLIKDSYDQILYN